MEFVDDRMHYNTLHVPYMPVNLCIIPPDTTAGNTNYYWPPVVTVVDTPVFSEPLHQISLVMTDVDPPTIHESLPSMPLELI